MASSSHNLSPEAGLPGSFRWQDFTSSEDPENVQILEQAQSSRWSLSTAGTPLEGLFPSNPRSVSRSKLVAASTSMSDLRAKSLYDESGRKKALLNKFRRHADPLIIPSAKKPHPLTLTVGMKDVAKVCEHLRIKIQAQPLADEEITRRRVVHLRF
ncbi:hypothetical protein LENED_009562 [Lentinula edodes]|uniref:Uncharacterized protein n=1 Tax=Lentinula edodes TaxID=5353 RepID=A0A1Q3EK27_LENED|nr:hypothetical protein LENED_009562 [Lentinula edodes]